MRRLNRHTQSEMTGSFFLIPSGFRLPEVAGKVLSNNGTGSSGNFRIRSVCTFNICRVAKWQKLNARIRNFRAFNFHAFNFRRLSN